MGEAFTRRSMLATGARFGALAGAGELAFLGRLSPVSAQEAVVNPRQLRIDNGVAPVVKLLEETPRDTLLEVVAEEIRRGLSYRELLAGLLLAGVKNIEPRPSVGFKFHAVLVVNSAHLASLASPPEHRWLPIFWSLDYYKSAAARDVRERGDWTMQPVDDSQLPTATSAHAALVDALDRWDEPGADRAIACLARTAGMQQIYETMIRYGMRDFRSIGHKAIFVANSYRTLASIGWQHAEPVLRSLVYALLMHEGDNPAQRDAEADRPFRRNEGLAAQIQPGWQQENVQTAATEDLLELLHHGTNDQACDLVVQLLNDGAGPQSIWDALHMAAGELLMRQPAIVALHAVTTTNALRFCYQTSGNDETRRLLMLQAAAFLPMFRAAMESRGEVRPATVADLHAASLDETGGDALGEIFATLSNDPHAAAHQLFGYLQQGGDAGGRAGQVIDAARLLVFLKGTNAHDYKFSSAMLEDYRLVSPHWRNRYLAANIYKLRGSAEPDNQLVARTRAALEA